MEPEQAKAERRDERLLRVVRCSAGSRRLNRPSTRASANAARPSAAMTADGPIVAFRDRTDGRDSRHPRRAHRSPSTPQGQARGPTRCSVHDDKWKIDACPGERPGGGRTRQRRGRGVVHGRSTTTARRTPRSRTMPDARGARPSAWTTTRRSATWTSSSLDDGSAVATWVEFANERSQFSARKVQAVRRTLEGGRDRRRGRGARQRLSAHARSAERISSLPGRNQAGRERRS